MKISSTQKVLISSVLGVVLLGAFLFAIWTALVSMKAPDWVAAVIAYLLLRDLMNMFWVEEK